LLAPGVYNSTEPGKTPHEVRVSVLPNGMTQLDDPSSDDGDAVYGFVPLTGDGSRFLVWMSKMGDSSRGDTQLFLLGERNGPEISIFVPDCRDVDAKVAVAAGAVVEGSPPSCRFPTKAAARRAASKIRAAGHELLTMRRVP